jgi:cob(I)alamin adenosyltransferase
MAHVYTRTGDDGTTSLIAGRVDKDAPRIELLGAVDEANSHIGLARMGVVDSELDDILAFVQHRLFNCSACVAGAKPSPETPRISPVDIEALEAAIDHYDERSAGFAGFMLPGCDEASARLHVARTVMRRAERRAVTLARHEDVDPLVLAFLNRASDLLYVAARFSASGSECAWRPDLPAPGS